MSLGAIITTTNPLNTTGEIAKQIADSKPVLAFTTCQLIFKIAGSALGLPIVLIDDDEMNSNPKSTIHDRNNNDKIVSSLGEGQIRFMSRLTIMTLFTYIPLMPPILVELLNSADQVKAKYDLSSLSRVLSGGALLSKEVTEGFLEKYSTVAILQGYGLTESTGVGASTDSIEESRRYGTTGKLSASMEAKIMDPDSGEALGVNRTGELWLKGPSS